MLVSWNPDFLSFKVSLLSFSNFILRYFRRFKIFFSAMSNSHFRKASFCWFSNCIIVVGMYSKRHFLQSCPCYFLMPSKSSSKLRSTHCYDRVIVSNICPLFFKVANLAAKFPLKTKSFYRFLLTSAVEQCLTKILFVKSRSFGSCPGAMFFRLRVFPRDFILIGFL